MRIIKIIDVADRGAVVQYQCDECFLVVTVSEQARTKMSPVRQHEIYNYRGELIEDMLSAKTDSRYRNTIDHLMKLLADHNIPIEGIPVPDYVISSSKRPTGLYTTKMDELLGTVAKVLTGDGDILIPHDIATELHNVITDYIKLWKVEKRRVDKQGN